jgi:hypothetical protein
VEASVVGGDAIGQASRCSLALTADTYLAREDLGNEFTQRNLELPIAPLDANFDSNQSVGRGGDVGCHVCCRTVAVAAYEELSEQLGRMPGDDSG